MKATTVLALFLFVLAEPAASAQGARLSGVLEDYYWAYSTGNRWEASTRARWLRLESELKPGLRLVGGALTLRGSDMLDENYVEWERGALHGRAGRMRASFGQADWEDTYYTGFSRLPIMRTLPIGKGMLLTRFDAGAEIGGGGGAVQWTAGVLDTGAATGQMSPQRWDHSLVRVQAYRGPLIVGANALIGPGGGERSSHLYLLDWRWSHPQWIVRGELLAGSAAGGAARGYHVDAAFHPVGLHRTTFVARMEGSFAPELGGAGGYGAPIVPGRSWASLYTLGIRQVLSPLFTLQVSHGWGNRTAGALELDGWAVQATISRNLK